MAGRGRSSARRPTVPTENRLTATLEALHEVERRVLWLAVRMVDIANHERRHDDGIKVGGHQASSASLVSVMTALYFSHLDPEDKVSVKPHASPVLHAIEYLLGGLDRSYLSTLRAMGGLQAYPSRTKDPDRVDFSTGSVGLGAAAPLFAAVTRRYVDAHFGERPPSRFVSLLGDAELDEGNVWEAIADPACADLGSVLWVVDFNRQSLDRVVPGVRIEQWSTQFKASGWHVVELKYGRRLQETFARSGGEHLESWLDSMSNEQYQACFGLPALELRAQFLAGAPSAVVEFCRGLPDEELALIVTDLGGHDLASLTDAFAACDAVTDKASVVFAYTVKGWGLPIAGRARNHSALLSVEQIEQLRTELGLDKDGELDRLDPATPAGRLAAERGRHLGRIEGDAGSAAPGQHLVGQVAPAGALTCTVPCSLDLRIGTGRISTQDAFGRLLVELSRHDGVAPYLVTTAPDVATSTNLAGLINRVGVFSPYARPRWDNDALLKWDEGPAGRHIELGISEMNFFLLLGQLGLSGDLSGQQLLPVGTVYDPFVLRGLDALLYSLYSGARFVVAGTPSGVTLAPEGGAHQSTITASVGLELPCLTLLEPAYATCLNWLLCDAIGRIAMAQPLELPEHGGSFYLRLTTRPLDQAPFEDLLSRVSEQGLRAQVIAGAYRLRDATDLERNGAPALNLAGSGSVLPEILAASALLADEGVAAHVVDVTSLDRCYRAWQATTRAAVREARPVEVPSVLGRAFAVGRPVVTVHDAAPHAMAWLGGALGVPAVSLGVDGFGQSGSLQEIYSTFDLTPEAIVNASLAVLGR